jgi:hypothetical protein
MALEMRMPVDASTISLELIILEFLTLKHQLANTRGLSEELRSRIHHQLLKLLDMISDAAEFSDDAAFLLDDIFEFDSLELKSGSAYNTMKINLRAVSAVRFRDIILKSLGICVSIKNFKGIRFDCSGNLFDEAFIADDYYDGVKSNENELKTSDINLNSLTMTLALYADDNRLAQLVRMILRYAIILTTEESKILVKGNSHHQPWSVCLS